jgi:hypothetical protein
VWTVKEFSLGFGEAAVGDVPITLIAEKTDARFCSGEAFTRDTLTKVLHVKRFSLNAYLSNPIFGRWQGHDEGEPDKLFEIEIQPAGGGVGINGLLPDCVDIGMNDAGMLFRHFWFDTGRRECRRMCGIGALQMDNQTLIIDYNYDLDLDHAPGERIKRRFIGKKIE